MLIVAIFFSLKKAVGLLDEALQRKAKLTLSFQTKSINYWNFKEKKKKKNGKLPNYPILNILSIFLLSGLIGIPCCFQSLAPFSPLRSGNLLSSFFFPLSQSKTSKRTG